MTQESKGSDPSSFLSEVIECGERTVQRDYRVALRDICENNYIKEGDIIIIYVKKKKKIL
jgi:hypothetical protein